MGILEDYMNEDSSPAVPKVKETGGSSIVNMYLNSGDDTPSKPVANPDGSVNLAPNPVADVILPKGAIKNPTTNPRDEEGIISGIKNTPRYAYGKASENFQGAYDTLSSGLSDIASNKPASGVGKVGLGLLSGLTALPDTAISTAISRPVTEITGNPDIGDRVGTVIGFGSPLLKGAGAAVKAVPTNKALRTLVDSIGVENLPTVVNEMKANPRLTPADISANVRQDLQGLYTVDGKHVDYLDKATKQRQATAASDIQQHMDKNLGPMVDPVAKIEELTNNIKRVGKEKIEPVLKETGPVDLTDVIKHIDDQTKPSLTTFLKSKQLPLSDQAKIELQQIRKFLTDDKSMNIHAEDLHQLQSSIRSEADNLIKHGGQDARAGYALHGLRQKIIDAIDTAGPKNEAGEGLYRKGLAGYRDEYHIKDAFEHGHDSIMSNSKDLESRPEFFNKWVKDASPEELEAGRQGARVAYDTQMNGFKHAARRGTDIGDVNFNRDRMTALFGKEQADTMFKVFEDAKNIADTNNKLTQGSMTAMRMARKGKFEMPEAGDLAKTLIPPAILEGASAMASGTPLVGTALYAGIKGAGKAKNAVESALAREHNSQFAKYALPSDPQARIDLIQKLDAMVKTPPKMSLLSKLSTAVKP